MMDTILLFDKRIKECVEKGVVLSKVSESGIAETLSELNTRLEMTILMVRSMIYREKSTKHLTS